MREGFLVEGHCRALMSFVAHTSRAYAIQPVAHSCYARNWNGRHYTPDATSNPATRQTCGARPAPGRCMTRWFAATAPQSSAASVEPRSNPPTNSPSARPWRSHASIRLPRGGKTRWPPSSRWPALAGSWAPEWQPSALRRLCVYITFCLLFWQGQWQLVFKPSRGHLPPLRPPPA